MTGQCAALVVGVEVWAAPFLELLFGLVAEASATGSAHGTTDDRAGRPTDGAAHDGTGSGATERTCAGPGFIIGSLGGFTGHRSADRADRATDDRSRRSTDGRADGCPAECAGAGAHGLAADFLVIGRIPAIHRPVHGLSVQIRIERICVGIDATCVVRSVHAGHLLGRVALGAS
jgi:hypothetical protein